MSELKLEVGKKYTIVIISNISAMTIKQEITVVGTRSRDGKTIYIYKNKDKRLEFELEIGRGFIFEGWNVPFRVDTDSGSTVIRGNACFNFVGHHNTIRDWIDNKNLNPDANKAIALAVDGAVEGFLYPELAEKSDHAVIRRMIKKRICEEVKQ